MQAVETQTGMTIPNRHGTCSRLRRFRRFSASPAEIVFAALLSFFAIPALGADGQSSLARVGFVDIPYLIDRAPQALEAERRLESEFEPRQRELEQQRAELARLTAQLANSQSELDDEVLAQLDREARGLERRVRRAEQDFREELNIEKNNEFKNVRVLVLEAIAEFGKRENYDLIVSDGVLFAHPRVDVTERILESLTREFEQMQSAN